MYSGWTREDIKAILLQLNERNLPFDAYKFSLYNNDLVMLGKGSSAHIYRATKKKTFDAMMGENYAIKVIGFNNEHIESDDFVEMANKQKLLYPGNNIVRTYDAKELLVWIEGDHTVVNAKEINSENIYETDKNELKNCLHLQFILMREYVPIISDKKIVKDSKLPIQFVNLEYKEVLNFALQITNALVASHNNNIIHRDIKLENIFYSPKHNSYLLGDFGIAKTMYDGFADSVAFTPGYGAPEVVCLQDDSYDCTADIYSFGMVLYLLLNDLKFPCSNGYRPIALQYKPGFEAPSPRWGSDGIKEIILKMISYNPDDRYQSMEEVQDALINLKYGGKVGYQREHKDTPLVLGTSLLVIGAVVWKLSFMKDLEINLDGWMYAFLTLGIVKSILKYLNKKAYIGTCVFLVGVAWLIFGHFSWWIFALVVYLMLSDGVISGIFCIDMCIIVEVQKMIDHNTIILDNVNDLRWITILIISIGVYMIFINDYLRNYDETMTNFVSKRSRCWLYIIAFYFGIFLNGISLERNANRNIDILANIIGEAAQDWLLSINLTMVGLCGMAFFAFWWLREVVLGDGPFCTGSVTFARK